MKTKKILAIMTLVAFMISILPMAAFASADYNVYGSVVSVEEDSASAVSVATATDKGLEYEVTLVSGSTGTVTGNLYVKTNRDNTDTIYYKGSDKKWHKYTGPIDVDAFASARTVSVDIKIVSNIAGNIKVAFGNDPLAVDDYVNGRDFKTDNSIGNIIGQKLYDGTFTASGVETVELKLLTSDVAANGVSYHEVEAYVESASSFPVRGMDVTFSISGTGATLSSTKVETGVNGKAKVKITATKPGKYDITAKADGKEDTLEDVEFKSTGVVDIKAESDNNQKIAIDSGNKEFKYSLYDAAGNQVSDADKSDIEVDVVKEPSKSDLDLDETDLSVDGKELILTINTKDLEEGDYEVRVYLLNGKQVTYAFSAKEQGDIVSMKLEYNASSYAAESRVPSPKIKYADAEGYTVEKTGTDISADVKFSTNDATFIKEWAKSSWGVANKPGSFDLDDKIGSFIITAVDTDENLVATYNISVGKAASALKLNVPSYTAIGEDAKVEIQLVDADGKAVAPGVKADKANAFVLSKPEGAIVSIDDVKTGDFEDGEASVEVSSNASGNVVIQVIITDVDGKSYTGSASVPFGEAAALNKSLIMFIGANNYLVGNQPAVTDAAPFIENGRTYVAVRPIGDALGMTIYWDQDTQTVTMEKPGEKVTIVVGANTIKVDRAGVVTEYPTDAPAQVKDGRTFLPFRAIGEAMGYTVNWDEATQAVIFS